MSRDGMIKSSQFILINCFMVWQGNPVIINLEKGGKKKYLNFQGILKTLKKSKQIRKRKTICITNCVKDSR